MAIDTEAKRCSALATRRLPWFRRFAPLPDGTVDRADRQQLALVYVGITALPPEPPQDGGSWQERRANTWHEPGRGNVWTARRKRIWQQT